MPSVPDAIGVARNWLQAARRIAVLSGAGISAESGVPTFRDAQTGWWARFRPEELATEDAFRSDPERVWNWYALRREMTGKAEPNAAHHALAQFQQRHPGRLTVITQNVDDLHQRAGSTGVLALHGRLLEDCWLDAPRDCCRPGAVTNQTPPRCPVCGNARRPAVVWFGEVLPAQAFGDAQQAAQDCDAMLVLGTSGAVHPAAGLALTAREAGARVIIVNPEASELDSAAHLLLRARAAQTVPALLDF